MGGVVVGTAVLSIGGLGGSEHVFLVSLKDGRTVDCGAGRLPVVTSDGKWIVFWRGGVGSQDTLVRMASSIERTPRTEDAVPVSPAIVGRWLREFPVVAVGGSRVAALAADGSVWECDVASGEGRRIGGSGRIPDFMVAGTSDMVCSDMERLREHFLLNLQSGDEERLSVLDGMIGCAADPAKQRALVVVPGPPRPGRDSFRLMLVDLRSRKTRCIVDDIYFDGNAVWLEGDQPSQPGAAIKE